MEDEPTQAQKALLEQFRRERTDKEFSPPGKTQRDSRLRRRATGWMVVWGIVGLVLVVMGIFLAPVVAGAIERGRVADTAKHFCFAISEDDYSTAYSMLSTGARARFSQAELADAFKQAHVAACETNQQISDFTISNGHASVAISFVRADDTGAAIAGKYGGDMLLVQEDGGWKVDGFVASQGDIFA